MSEPAPVIDSNEQHADILLVDDDPSVRAALRRIVRHLGYRAIEAESALEACERIAEGVTFRGAILDYMMPGMGGVDLARRIRERDPELPVLILSGGVLDDAIRSAIEDGVLWAYVPKPWDLGWLRRAVNSMMSGEPAPPHERDIDLRAG